MTTAAGGRAPGPISEALVTLLGCRSVALQGKTASVRKPLSRRSRGPVDLLIGGEPLERLRPRAAAHRAASLPSLDLGEDGALWRPGLAYGLPPYPELGDEHERGVVVITQRTTVADHLLGEAARRELPLLAAVATGGRRPQRWRDLALAAAAIPQVQLVLVALQQQIDLDDLATCARGGGPLLLHLSDAARQLHVAKRSFYCEATTEDVAPALGLPCFATLSQLCEGARHLLAGLRPRHRRVLPIVREAHEIPLLERALEVAGLKPAKLARELAAAGLRTEGPYVLAPGRQHLLSRALRRARPLAADALVCAGRVPRALDVALPQLCVGPFAAAPPARAVDESGLGALGALLAAQPLRRPPPSTTASSALPSHLDERAIKDLAQRHGLDRVDERVVASATAAAKAATELEPPLSVRPLLASAPAASAERARVQRDGLDSTASVRQAFRDVLFACAELYPDEPLDGLIVAEAPPPGLTLDCLLLFPAELPLARLAVMRDEAIRHGSARWVRLPLREAERAELASDLARQAPGREQRQLTRAALAELRRLLECLERLAVQGAAELRWLSLSPLRVPEDGQPARLVAARGDRRGPERSAESHQARPRS
ncbi:MAG: hypothetical protein CSA65_04025 [Proteobacteria bacterium]|nr:MAG: hypothetical protein CSA65_04025 [Pseudomonadota bacterium]